MNLKNINLEKPVLPRVNIYYLISLAKCQESINLLPGIGKREKRVSDDRVRFLLQEMEMSQSYIVVVVTQLHKHTKAI